MANWLVQRDGRKATTTQALDKHPALPQITVCGNVHVRSAVLANGDVEYRWDRYEPPPTK